MGNKIDISELMNKTELKRLMDKNIEKEKEKLADLKLRSKDLSELVQTEMFLVDGVHRKTYAQTKPSEHLNDTYGTRRDSDYIVTGYVSKIMLSVIPENDDLLIRTLEFDGISAVRGGDKIIAKIPRYKKVVAPKFLFLEPFEQTEFYMDREYRIIEKAIEIAILSEDKNTKSITRDIAIDYKKYIKK